MIIHNSKLCPTDAWKICDQNHKHGCGGEEFGAMLYFKWRVKFDPDNIKEIPETANVSYIDEINKDWNLYYHNANDYYIAVLKKSTHPFLEEEAKSKAQQRFFGMVHAVQKGALKKGDVSDDVLKAAKSMKKKDVNDFAETKHKGLPNKVKKDKKKSKKKVVKLKESQLKQIIKESVKKILINL